MACTRCGGFLVIEDWDGSVATSVRSSSAARNVRCVNCGSIDDSMILANRLIERITICCTTR